MTLTKRDLYPMAYFLSWRTYGTWLPGDPRGWNSRHGGGPFPPDPVLEARCREQMRSQPMYLTSDHRRVVEASFRQSVAYREWALHGIMVRRAHVHMVVSAPLPPEDVVGDLKRWATRRLREHDPALRGRDIWERGASMRYLRTRRSVRGVLVYVYDDHHTRP